MEKIDVGEITRLATQSALDIIDEALLGSNGPSGPCGDSLAVELDALIRASIDAHLDSVVI